jgi:hypothetical protein
MSAVGVLPIPISVIRDYCELFYITSIEQRDRIFRYVSAMDNTYLERVSKKQAK